MPRPRMGRYADRTEAGRVLADRLLAYAGGDVLVLALPRGGVPVAAEVAGALRAELDVLVVRKVGAPGRPELAMGAVAGVGGDLEVVRNDDVLRRLEVPAEVFDAALRREVVELRRREQAYRGGRPAALVTGRTVVLVDDGLATGSTMRAGVAAVRGRGPGRLVVAVPIGSARTLRLLAAAVGEVVCPLVPDDYSAVSQAYVDFAQTSDDEVRQALGARSGGGPRPGERA